MCVNLSASNSAVPRRRDSAPWWTLLWAAIAFACSVALSFWALGGQRNDPVTSRALPTARPRAISYAPAAADPDQVRRGYERVQEIYAERGIPGVIEVAGACRDLVASQPSRLDFCLAFALDGASLATTSTDPIARLWAERAPAEELSLAQSALPPGQDAAARLAAIRMLTRQTVTPEGSPTLRQHAPGGRSELLLARAGAKDRRASASLCHSHTTPAPGFCASGRLREQDRRLAVAYRRALARSAHPARLERQQAQWAARVAAAPNARAVAHLYHVRLVQLSPPPAPHRGHAARTRPPDLDAFLHSVNYDPTLPPY